MVIKFKFEEKMELILENLYLIIMACWIGYFFLNTTTFENMWNPQIYNFLEILLVIFILLRACASKGSNMGELFLVFLVSIVFLIAKDKNGYGALIDILLMIWGARGISFRKIVKVYLVVIAGFLGFTMIMALTGRIDNLVFYQAGRRPRMAFGIAYPTDFSAYVFYLLLAYFYLRGKLVKYFELGISSIIALVMYWFCDTRLNTICILIMTIIFGYNKIMNDRCEKKKEEYKMNNILALLLSASPAIFGLCMTFMSLFYNPDNKIWYMINSILNNRLMYGNKGILVHGYSWWGKYIPMQGNGGSTKEVIHYYFLDSSYIYIGLQYGILVLAVIMFVWVCIGNKAWKEKNWELLWVLALVGMQCAIEHHMTGVPYSLFMWALLAHTKKKNNQGGIYYEENS